MCNTLNSEFKIQEVEGKHHRPKKKGITQKTVAFFHHFLFFGRMAPQDEKSPLLTSGDGRLNRNSNVVPSSPGPKHQKRRNSDGSLDFERIVNGYSIQGELVIKMYAVAVSNGA